MATKKQAAARAPHLHVSDDGRIWWPVAKASHYVIPGRTSAAVANRRLLTDALQGALTDAEREEIAGPPAPRVVKRDAVACVDAGDYLAWMTQWIAISQSAIPFPEALAREVRSAMPGSPRRARLGTPIRGTWDEVDKALQAVRAKPKRAASQQEKRESMLAAFNQGFGRVEGERTAERKIQALESAAQEREAKTKAQQREASKAGAVKRQETAAFERAQWRACAEPLWREDLTLPVKTVAAKVIKMMGESQGPVRAQRVIVKALAGLKREVASKMSCGTKR